MVDIGTLRKPLRKWEIEEVTIFLKGLITEDEEELFVHNNMTGSRLKDFCCVDFLVHVLRLSESSAAKVMSVLRPYLDEVDDTQCSTRREYRFVLRKRYKNSKLRTKKPQGKSAEDLYHDSETTNGDTKHRNRSTRKNVKKEIDENERHSSGDDRTMDNPGTIVAKKAEESYDVHSCSTQNETAIEHLRLENT